MLANKTLLSRIANYLIINASSVNHLGLYHGKMGLVLFFEHYARYTGINFYEDFAEELLNDICENINSDLSIDFENGLTGIAWGIEYLVQNEFIEGNTSDILFEINKIIIERDPLRMQDVSFNRGILGIAYYFACHISMVKDNMSQYYFKYLYEMKCALVVNRIKFNEIKIYKRIYPFYKLINSGEVYCKIKCQFPQDLLNPVSIDLLERKELSSFHLGLHLGLAGIGLNEMLK